MSISIKKARELSGDEVRELTNENIKDMTKFLEFLADLEIEEIEKKSHRKTVGLLPEMGV